MSLQIKNGLTKRAQMKGEVKGADELRIKGLHVAQWSEKTAAPHYHFYKAVKKC